PGYRDLSLCWSWNLCQLQGVSSFAPVAPVGSGAGAGVAVGLAAEYHAGASLLEFLRGAGRVAIARRLPLDQLAEGDLVEEVEDLLAQVRPQLVGQAALAVAAVLAPAAAGDVDLLVDRRDDIGDRDLSRTARQPVAPSGT